MKEHNWVEIEPSAYMPTESSLICDKMADILEQMSGLLKWRDAYQALPMHQVLRYILEQAATPPTQREPPLPSDEGWFEGQVQVILMYGAVRCIAADTFVRYTIATPEGRPQNKKGGTIAHLYRRFHGLPRPGLGNYQRPQTVGSHYLAPSVDAEGRLKLNRILDVVYAGEKPCIEIVLATGARLVCTAEHHVLTPNGFVCAGDLVCGSLVMVEPQRSKVLRPYKRPKRPERAYIYVQHHPIAGQKTVHPKSSRTEYAYTYRRLLRSRAMVEASLSGLSFAEYVTRLDEGRLEGLSFLPRSIEVHHKNEDATDDRLENFELLTQAEHARHHTAEREWMLAKAVPAEVVSVNSCGVRAAYDMVMEDPMNNFVANSIVVHNSGKTNSAVACAYEDMCGCPGLRILTARHTYDEIRDTIFGDMLAFASRYGITLGPGQGYREDPPEIDVINGSQVILRSVKRDEKPGQDKASSLQGTEYGAAIIEEADRCPEWFVDTVVGRLSQSGLKNPWVLILCNPPSKGHWLYERFFKRRRANYHTLYYKLEDNRHNLAQGFIENLVAELSQSPSRFARFVKGEFSPSVNGRAIFRRSFRVEVHTRPGYDARMGKPQRPGALLPVEGVELWGGLDFGFVHPAVVIAQEDPDSGQIRVLWEYMGNEVLEEAFIKDVQRRIGSRFPGFPVKWFVDPHGRARNSQTGRSSLQVLKDCGIFPVFKDVPVSVGLSSIDALLTTMTHVDDDRPSEPLLVIADNCETLIDAFSYGYVQDPKRQVEGADDDLTPYKDGFFEHEMDALRYIIINTRLAAKSRKGRRQQIGRKGKWEAMKGEEEDPYRRQQMYALQEAFEGGGSENDRPATYGFGQNGDDYYA